MQWEPAADSSAPGFVPLVVLELASDTKQEAAAWLQGRITAPQGSAGVDVPPPPSACCSAPWLTLSTVSGAELQVELLGPGLGAQKDNPNVLLVGASWQRLLSGAEDLGLFKEYSDGSMRGFTCDNKHNFKDFKGVKFWPVCVFVSPLAKYLMNHCIYLDETRRGWSWDAHVQLTDCCMCML